MKIYQVGGSVRDQLMGHSPEDRDWVVIGSTVQQMLDLGYNQVGADFPVFLHPVTHEEYALGRTERKTAGGYHGFSVCTENVTLEEDLSRRDLTINAMALDEKGALVDPFGGRADLANKVLRHVGPAFSEDPVRILRILRFQARFGPAWSIAPETAQLLQSMVESGEADNLVPERIWKELSRSLVEPYAEHFCDGLARFGLLERKPFTELRHAIHSGVDPKANEVHKAARRRGASLFARFCVVFATRAPRGHFSEPGMVPKELRRAAHALTEVLPPMVASGSARYDALDASSRLQLLQRMGALSAQREQFDVVKTALACWVEGQELSFEPLQALGRDVERARGLDTKVITASLPPGPAVGQAIEQARIRALG